VYKIHRLCGGPVDFVLASGGHNAGIVSEPGHPNRSYRTAPPRSAQSGYRGPDAWLEQAETVDGSWWPYWQQWLAGHAGGARVAPPAMDADGALGAAPGVYVLAGAPAVLP
jgi:polyhydroxyalkanoate synthase